MIKLSLLFNIRKPVSTVYAGDSQEKLNSFLNGHKEAHCKVYIHLSMFSFPHKVTFQNCTASQA